IGRAMEVIKNSRPIAQLNAARTLARLVARGTRGAHKDYVEEVRQRLAGGNAKLLGETLIGLVEADKANMGGQYYALTGLRDLLKVARFQADLLPREVTLHAAKAAQKLAETAQKFPERAPQEEINGFRALRRQALSVLAEARVLGAKDGPGMTMLRFVV